MSHAHTKDMLANPMVSRLALEHDHLEGSGRYHRGIIWLEILRYVWEVLLQADEDRRHGKEGIVNDSLA